MIGNILGVIGIIFTIVFGLYSIWTYKKSKRKVSLEFKNEQCYSLFRDDVTRLNIEIIYNKKTLTNALILLKAKIVNNGSIDIDKNRIFKPVKIISLKEFVWLEARTTSQPNGSSSSITILNPNEIQIEWDLLKKEEFIEFEALIEIIDNSKVDGAKTLAFYNGLTFDYRITDLNIIQKEKKIPIKTPFDIIFKYSKAFAVFTILLGALAICSEYIPVLSFLPDKHEALLKIDNGTIQRKGYFDTKRNGDLIFNFTDTDEQINISIEEFNKKYKIINLENTIIPKKESLFNKLIGGLYIVLGTILFILKSRIDRKKKIKKM